MGEGAGPLAGIDAVILAGGLGTRLAPVLSDRPKALAPVRGRPFLDRLLDRLAREGCPRIVLAVGHRADQIAAHAATRPPGGPALLLSREPEPLGTGGALRLALGRTASDPLLVLNGDSWLDCDYGALVAAHRRTGARATLALTRVGDAGRYGAVELAPSGAIAAFREKLPGAGPGLINGGVGLLARALVAAIPEGRAVSLERDVLAALAGRDLFGLAGDGAFIDIGTPESLRAAETFFGD